MVKLRGPLLAAMLACTGLTVPNALAYPDRPVKVIVPGPPGGASDILARTIAEQLSIRLGQQLIVDSRAGATGIIGAELTARAAPDGYTIMVGHTGTRAINVSLRKHLPYDPVRDFVPLTLAATAPNVLVVHPSLPVHTVKELIALAKAKPDEITFASAGIGFSRHLAGVLFCSMAGVKMLHVPYKAALTAWYVIGGNVLLMFPNIPSSLPHIRAGRLRALGVTSAQRSAVLPDVPTIAESGLPGYEASAWFGFFGPAGMSAAVVQSLNTEMVAALNRSQVRSRVRNLGADPVGNTPAEFHTFVVAQIAKWAKVIRAAGLKMQ